MRNVISWFALAGAFGFAFMAGTAQAATQYYVQSGAHCEAADGALVYGLQKTKTGLKNTSPGTRYITCSNTTIASGYAISFQYPYAAARFDGPIGAKVTCALHVGDADHTYGSVSNSIIIAADGYSKIMRFGTGYTSAIPPRLSVLSYATMTCALPAGVEIQMDLIQIDDSVS